VEIIFRNKNVEEETRAYTEKFANPLSAARRGTRFSTLLLLLWLALAPFVRLLLAAAR
jgi:hypothetical protein